MFNKLKQEYAENYLLHHMQILIAVITKIYTTTDLN